MFSACGAADGRGTTNVSCGACCVPVSRSHHCAPAVMSAAHAIPSLCAFSRMSLCAPQCSPPAACPANPGCNAGMVVGPVLLLSAPAPGPAPTCRARSPPVAHHRVCHNTVHSPVEFLPMHLRAPTPAPRQLLRPRANVSPVRPHCTSACLCAALSHPAHPFNSSPPAAGRIASSACGAAVVAGPSPPRRYCCHNTGISTHPCCTCLPCGGVSRRSAAAHLSS